MRVTMVDDPDGFHAIDRHTLVLSIASSAPIKQTIADLQWPAILITNTVEITQTT